MNVGLIHGFVGGGGGTEKTLLTIILIGAAGFLAYKYLLNDKTVLEIDADKSITTQSSMDIDAPALAPAKYGSVQGTVTNVSDNVVTNIALKSKFHQMKIKSMTLKYEGNAEYTDFEDIILHQDANSDGAVSENDPLVKELPAFTGTAGDDIFLNLFPPN